MSERKLTILLVSSPSSARFSLGVRLAERALSKGAQVNVFLMGEAVYGILKEPLQKLSDLGVNVVACRHNAENKGVGRESFNRVKSGSQYDFSHMVKDSHVILKL